MPWTPNDAEGKTHKANTPAKKSKWSKIANAVLDRTGDEASAIKIANSKMKPKRKLSARMRGTSA